MMPSEPVTGNDSKAPGPETDDSLAEGDDWQSGVATHVARAQEIFAMNLEKKERLVEATIQRLNSRIATLEAFCERSEERAADSEKYVRDVSDELRGLVFRVESSDAKCTELRTSLESQAEHKFSILESRLEEVRNDTQQKFEDLESRLAEMKSEGKAFAWKTEEIQTHQFNRVHALEKENRDRKEQENTAIDELKMRMVQLEMALDQNSQAVCKVVDQLAEACDGTDAKVSGVEDVISDLRSQVDFLNASALGEDGTHKRVEELESRVASFATKLEGASPAAPTHGTVVPWDSDDEVLDAPANEAEMQALAEQEAADRLHAETTQRVAELVLHLKEIVPRVHNHEVTLEQISKQLGLIVEQGQARAVAGGQVLESARDSLQQQFSAIQQRQQYLADQLHISADKTEQGIVQEPLQVNSPEDAVASPEDGLQQQVGAVQQRQQYLVDKFQISADKTEQVFVQDPLQVNSPKDATASLEDGLQQQLGAIQQRQQYLVDQFQISADKTEQGIVQKPLQGNSSGDAVVSLRPDVTASLEANAKKILDRITASTTELHDMQKQLESKVQLMAGMMTNVPKPLAEDAGAKLAKSHDPTMTHALLQQFSIIVNRLGDNEKKNMELQQNVVTHMFEVKEMMGQMAHVIVRATSPDDVSTSVGSPSSDAVRLGPSSIPGPDELEPIGAETPVFPNSNAARRALDEEIASVDKRINQGDAACKEIEKSMQQSQVRLGGLFKPFRRRGGK